MASGNSFNAYLQKLEDFLDLYLIKKAPSLPEGLKQALVKFGPIVYTILLILGIVALLALIGISTFVVPFAAVAGGVNYGLHSLVQLAISIASLVFGLIALPGLFKQTKKGWRMLYYSYLLGVVGNIVSVSITNLLISIIFLYLIFQIKSYYK